MARLRGSSQDLIKAAIESLLLIKKLPPEYKNEAIDGVINFLKQEKDKFKKKS